MTTEDLEDKYPHWRDALFGNHNAVANIRCAVHYVFWHTVYAALAVLAGLVVGALKLAKFVARYLGPAGPPVIRGINRVGRAADAFFNHRYVSLAMRVLLVVGGIAIMLFALAVLVLTIINNPFEMLAALGFMVGGVIVIATSLVLFDKLSPAASRAASRGAVGARRAGEKAVQTPGIRRVYGECPVSMGQAPKWFDSIFPEDEYE